MNLTLISPFGKKTYQISWLEINTPQGNFVIQPGHAPMVISLTQKKPITFGLKNGKRESFVIQEGVVSVDRAQTTIITNQEL